MTMTGRLVSTLSLWSLCAGAFACEQPTVPDIPDDPVVAGRTEQGIAEEMLAYMLGMRQYVNCVLAELETASASGAAPVGPSLLGRRNNQAVAELEAMGRVYEARIGPLGDVGELAAGRCIQTRRDGFRYEIADGATVVVYTHDGKIYRNEVQACAPLQAGDEIEFAELSRRGQSDVCEGSAIVVGQDARCTLGTFRELTRSEAEALLD